MVIYRPVRCARTLNQSVLSLSMREMHRAFTVILLFTMVCCNVACSPREQLRKEASLQESLGVLRRGIRQFTLDHERPPTSLSQLESSGYFKRIPTDPFTGRNDTWRIEKSGDSFEVHSGADAVSSGGTRKVLLYASQQCGRWVDVSQFSDSRPISAQKFDDIMQAFERGVHQGKLLVHCVGGMSRSSNLG